MLTPRTARGLLLEGVMGVTDSRFVLGFSAGGRAVLQNPFGFLGLPAMMLL